MTDFIKEYRDQWGDDPSSLLNDYSYHTELTNDLDRLDPKELSNEILYKIVLWKLSRFPYISEQLANKLKSISKIKPKKHEEAKDTIKQLLRTQGIALPMASTILRFINPEAFQIIDDRAYRVLLPGEAKYPSKPQKITDGYLNKSIEIYFKYLDRIHQVVTEKLPFSKADRILYQLDIKLGNKIGE